jgi:hypothetical protein
VAAAGGLSNQNVTTVPETNGVGAAPAEDLRQRLPRVRIVGQASTMSSKEDAYGRLALLLAERAIVLPNHAELLRQLGGVSANPTPSGGLRIAARTESLHDDLPDALSLAVKGLPRDLATVAPWDVPDGQVWADTPAGVRVPVPVRTVEAGLSWSAPYARWCGECERMFHLDWAACPRCHPEEAREAREACRRPAPAGAAQAAAEPVHNAYAPDTMRCPQGHTYLSSYSEKCPKCHGRASAARSGRPTAPCWRCRRGCTALPISDTDAGRGIRWLLSVSVCGRGRSGPVDLETAADGGGDGLQVVLVRADHQVVTAYGSLDHARVDDVGGGGAGGERADGAGLAVIEGLHVASGQQPGQESLAASSAPRLCHHGRGDGGHFTARQQGTVAGPYAAFSPVGGDERAGVVGDAHHAVRRRVLLPVRLARSAAVAAHSSPSESSSGVNAPWSRSNWLTAARPARMVNSFRAVSASHAL